MPKRRSSGLKNRLNKAVLATGLICGAVFLTSAAATVWLLTCPVGKTVRITSEGEIIAEIDLSTAENQMLEVTCSSGRNMIKIEDGEIFVSEADCPDQTCVKMGSLGSGMPIVCLPHKLIIEFVGGENDAATG